MLLTKFCPQGSLVCSGEYCCLPIHAVVLSMIRLPSQERRYTGSESEEESSRVLADPEPEGFSSDSDDNIAQPPATFPHGNDPTRDTEAYRAALAIAKRLQ